MSADSSPLRRFAVLFDLDGVLVDSHASIERAWRAWASEARVDAAKVLAALPGARAEEVIRSVAPALDAAGQAALVDQAQIRDLAGVLAAPGAGELLEQLTARQLSWAVVTACPRALALARLRHCGLPEPAVLVGAESVSRGKPAPDSYLLGASALRVAPSGCVVVEDAPSGVLAGKRAGMRVIGVTSTHTREELTAADDVVARLLDVSDLLWAASAARSPIAFAERPSR